MGSGDKSGKVLQRRWSREVDIRIAIRDKVSIDLIGLHVEATPGHIQKAPHGQATVLGAINHQVDRWLTSEHRSLVRTAKPCQALLLRFEKDPQCLVDPKDCRDPG